MFIDTRLNDCVSLGFTGGPEWNTLVRAMASGVDMRRANWAMPHHRYTADYTVMEPEDQNDILAAFMAARGQLNSFRFKDWNDYIAENQAMDNGDGTSTPRQLTKSYTFGPTTFTREITLPLTDTVVVTANGTPISVTTNPLTGMVTPTSPWPSGQSIRASFQFDVRVRFGMDYAPFTRDQRVVARASVELVEALTP